MERPKSIVAFSLLLLPTLYFVGNVVNTINSAAWAHKSSVETPSLIKATPSPPLPPYPWQLIHPPKTGTSFVNAFYMLGCPEEYSENWTKEEIDMHTIFPGKGIQASAECKQRWTNGLGYDMGKGEGRPLREKYFIGDHTYRNTSIADKQIFMSLRDPVDRIISYLFFDKRLSLMGMKPVEDATTDSELAQIIVEHPLLHTPTLGQMMTYHFLPVPSPGYEELSSKSIEYLVEDACLVVQNMGGVVFVDDYNRSICLLHALYDFPHHPYEMVNVRPTSSRKSSSINKTAVGALVREQTEIMDDVVYNCARERFLRDLEQYAPQCL